MPYSLKMKALFGVLIVAVIAAIIAVSVSAASTGGADTQGPAKYICIITTGPGGRSNITGTVTFTQASETSPVQLEGALSGFEPNVDRAFHVHQFGDFSDANNPCMSTGGHFNPENMDHGAPQDAVRHVGDLGNLKADDQGVIRISTEDKLLSLYPGERNIAGRACVVHGGIDDLGKGEGQSKQNGNAGPRVGCGIVGVAKV